MQQNVREAVLDFLNGAEPGRILDIPSGGGWLRDKLDSGQWDYHAADLFTGESSTKNFKKVDLNEDLPYEDSVFDVVACLEGLEHIENYHHALREFRRVLRPGGRLVISTPNPLNIKSRLRYLLTGTFYGFPHLVKVPSRGEHLHLTPINLSFLLALAGRYGLVLDRVHSLNVKPGMYRFVGHCLLLKLYNFIKNAGKKRDERKFKDRLVTMNVLLNDGIVVSFRKADVLSIARPEVVRPLDEEAAGA